MKKGEKYLIRVEVAGKVFTYYRAKILEINDSFVTFVDETNGTEISYNWNTVINYEKVRGHHD